MESSDSDFLRDLEAAFQVEADEHIQAMSAGLLEMESMPANQRSAPLIETVYREAHSLKGAARAVNNSGVETVCQSLETIFAAWKHSDIVPEPGYFDTLHQALDLVRTLVSAGKSGISVPDQHRMAVTMHDLSRFAHPSGESADHMLSAAENPDELSLPPSSVSSPSEPSERERQAHVDLAEPAPAARGTGRRPEEAAVVTNVIMSPETVRIATGKLDSLLRQSEEMLAIKLMAAHRAAQLHEAHTDVQAALRRWKSEWSRIAPDIGVQNQTPNAADQHKANRSTQDNRLIAFAESCLESLKSLDMRLHMLSKSADQDCRDIGNKVDTLLNDTKSLLMLPFSTLLDMFPRMVRDLATAEGKSVRLLLHGEDVEIDKRILEEMKDPLIHLLRNGVDHGIEDKVTRERANKAAQATVTISVSQVSGNEIEILVSDDGDGVDIDRVKAAAVKQGLVESEAASRMSDANALDLVFLSDISTSTIISEFSGRGLGLAIVREKVQKLGGHILLTSERGHGATFQILLPLRMATFRGILVQVADQTLVIPTASVEFAGRIPNEPPVTVENEETILVNGRLMAIVRLNDVLEIPSCSHGNDRLPYCPIVVLGSADTRIAFQVDAILNEQEVLVKPLGKPLQRVRNIAGATILGSGKPIPIINPADLLKSASKLAGAPSRTTPSKVDEAVPQSPILLVEDSITSRMLLKNILQSAGYQVTTAVDGFEAWAALQSQEFALVVSDVDMPHMDGFELTAHIRADKSLEQLPVVLVTVRESREDRERGVDVGANAYLVKSSFEQSNLLEIIRRLI